MLVGRDVADPNEEELSSITWADLTRPPAPIVYNPALPIETFDFIVNDECHCSIYNLWRQLLEYFDSSLIGLTATPSHQTLCLFVDKRHRQTRACRTGLLESNFSYQAGQLDGDVVAMDQIRTVIRTFSEYRFRQADRGPWLRLNGSDQL